MKHCYTEYTCDYCGCAEHFLTNVRHVRGKSPDQQARSYGWIITADGKHFDSQECYEHYKQAKQEHKKKLQNVNKVLDKINSL